MQARRQDRRIGQGDREEALAVAAGETGDALMGEQGGRGGGEEG